MTGDCQSASLKGTGSFSKLCTWHLQLLQWGDTLWPENWGKANEPFIPTVPGLLIEELLMSFYADSGFLGTLRIDAMLLDAFFF